MGIDRYLNYQCEAIDECFVFSIAESLDSDRFAETFLTSEYGMSILQDRRMIEYSDSGFMFEGLLREFNFAKGACHDRDVCGLQGVCTSIGSVQEMPIQSRCGS